MTKPDFDTGGEVVHDGPKMLAKNGSLQQFFSDTSLRVAGFKTYMQMKLVMVNALMEAQLVLV